MWDEPIVRLFEALDSGNRKLMKLLNIYVRIQYNFLSIIKKAKYIKEVKRVCGDVSTQINITEWNLTISDANNFRLKVLEVEAILMCRRNPGKWS